MPSRPGPVARVLDIAIVASFLILPHSFAAFLASSALGAPFYARLPFFVVPAMLVGARLLWPHARSGQRDLTPVVLCLLALLNGLGMALARTSYAMNVLSVYGQALFWLALGACFLRATAAHGGMYVLDTVRRVLVVIAAVAWVFTLLFIVAGDSLPYRLVTIQVDGGRSVVLGRDYFLSFAYSYHTVAGVEVPRFTFLYREPRVLGMQLVIGLCLQAGVAADALRAGRRGERWRAIGGLLALAGAIVWTHSVYTYLLVLLAAPWFVWPGLARLRSWQHLRAFACIVTVVAATVPVGVLMAAGGSADALESWTRDFTETSGLDRQLGKPAATIAAYVADWASAVPVTIARFPFGTGVMNEDSGEFERAWGVSTLQGNTLTSVFVQNAGVLGVFLLAWFLVRLLGSLQWIGSRTDRADVRAACLTGVILLFVSITVVDLLAWRPYAVLVFGALLLLPSDLRRAEGR